MMNRLRETLQRCTLIAVLAIAPLLAARGADAATITINDRGDCNCFTVMIQTFCRMYFDGFMTFSDTSNVLDKVESYVESEFAGAQYDSFQHVPGTGRWDYAKCASFEIREVGTGPYNTEDRAYMEGQEDPPVVTGQKQWSP